MRVLLCTRPFLGHAYPMVPLAAALRELGHDVAFATAAPFLPELERLGWVRRRQIRDALGDVLEEARA